MEERIQPVANNAEKAITYRERIRRYKRAYASGFFFECLWLLYALLEDRTTAFLYHLGITGERNRQSVTGSKKIKPLIREMIGMREDEKSYRLDTLNGKLDRIHQLLVWASASEKEETLFQKTVKSELQKLNNNHDFLKALDYLNNEWRSKRNQLVHALFNKQVRDSDEKMKDLIEKGYSSIRKMDDAVKTVKRRTIRDRFHIQ